jgi:hypothetical protein
MDVARERLLDPRKPIWNFVELGTTSQIGKNIEPREIGGAVWDSIINGAMGINYFIEDTAEGPCGETNDVVEDTTCANAVSATQEITKVDKQIKLLAPILNTESYRYTLNSKLDTMLKVYDGSCYIFAMLGLRGRPGSYTFRLPSQIDASHVQVVGESRSIAINGHSFLDDFTKEYTYHIYKIPLG